MKLDNARRGNPVKNEPGGFPLFFDRRKQRVVTADPWAFLAHLATTRLAKRQEAISNAYIQQGLEFFQGAQNPRLNSRPLLYYYAFLNLVKAALVIRGHQLPAAARHGISDPRANTRKRIRFEGQRVAINGRAHDHGEIFPEFVAMLGQTPRAGSIRVVDLLRLIPSVHRTFVTVEGCKPTFVPIAKIELRHFNSKVWARVRLNSKDKDVTDAIGVLRHRRLFSRVLNRVDSKRDTEIWYETEEVDGNKRGLDTGIAVLSRSLKSIGISSILTNTGYRYYFASVNPRAFLPHLAAAYGVAFYLANPHSGRTNATP